MKNSILIIGTVLLSLLLRYMVSLNSYSGAKTPPMFGDYEAQRHWMEITHNLNITDWYEQTEDNDLQYWGLDYPPLTAYHSKICGYIANLINPDWVALKTSHGYESYEHKLFMRNTVMVVDILIYIPAVIYYFPYVLSKESKMKQLSMSCLVLSYPGLILIDHGHFQYNCVSLGFVLLAVISFFKDCHLVGSIFFVFALNYKQMELYHSLPIFFYLLGVCYRQKNWFASFIKLASIGVIVIMTFILCWLPFLQSWDTATQVLLRLFPFQRGLFEDKVGNFWCAASFILKLKNNIHQDHIVILCAIPTFLASLPSCLNTMICRSKKKLLYCLCWCGDATNRQKPPRRKLYQKINCSLAFFLFSFQVHEKTILVVALPVCLVLPDSPVAAIWFLIISTVSMYPLLLRDGQSISYFALLSIFVIMAMLIIDMSKRSIWLKAAICLSLCTCVFAHISYGIVKPPPHLPDLFPLLFAVISCAHFLLFLLYFHYMQWACDLNDEHSVLGVFCDSNIKEKKIR